MKNIGMGVCGSQWVSCVLLAGLLSACGDDTSGGNNSSKSDAGADEDASTPDSTKDKNDGGKTQAKPDAEVADEDSGADTSTADGSAIDTSQDSDGAVETGDAEGGAQTTALVSDDSVTGTESMVTSDTSASSDPTTGTDSTSGQPACVQGAVCTPETPSECGIYTMDCTQLTPVCSRVGNQLPGTECGDGTVCSSVGTCETCVQGASCSPEASPCKQGTLDCSSGSVCTASNTNLPDGTICDAGKVCNDGACVGCIEDEACTPTEGACVEGRTRCGSGVEVCEAVRSLPAGEACGDGQVCDGEGECVACEAGGECVPENACHSGSVVCSSEGATCTDTGDALPNDIYCDVGKLCDDGTCVDAGDWVTLGEDNHTFTGGWVFTFESAGATITPATSATQAFVPSAGGRAGNALEVSGDMPPSQPDDSIYPASALGLTFADAATAVDLTQHGEGIQFYAKSLTDTTLVIQMADIWTDIKYSNCSTVQSDSVEHECYNYPAAECVVNSSSWSLCRLFWGDLERPDWGNLGAGAPLDAYNATFLLVGVTPTPEGDSTRGYQFAIDDVSFIPSE